MNKVHVLHLNLWEANTAAAKIIKEQPDYSFYENNCQKFAKYLVEAICPVSVYPETIHNFLRKWLNSGGHPEARTTLPGTYPTSPTTTESDAWTSDVERLNSTDVDNLALNSEATTPTSISSDNVLEVVEIDPSTWEDSLMADEIDSMHNRAARSTLPIEHLNSRDRDFDTNKVINQILKYMDHHQAQYHCIMTEEEVRVFGRSGTGWVVFRPIMI